MASHWCAEYLWYIDATSQWIWSLLSLGQFLALDGNKSLPSADGIKSPKEANGRCFPLWVSWVLISQDQPSASVLKDDAQCTSTNATVLLIQTALAIPAVQVCWILPANSRSSLFHKARRRMFEFLTFYFSWPHSSLHCKAVGKEALEQCYSLNYNFFIPCWDIIVGSTTASHLHCHWGILGQVHMLMLFCALWSVQLESHI